MLPWFRTFIEEHQRRFPSGAWPDAGDHAKHFWGGWQKALEKAGTTHEVATAASIRMQEGESIYPTDHLPVLLRRIKEVQADMARQGNFENLSSRDAAQAAARDCPMCEGQGFAYVESHEDNDKIVRGGSAYCYCAMGQWIRNQHLQDGPKGAPDVARRMINLAASEFARYRMTKYRYKPHYWQAAEGAEAYESKKPQPAQVQQYAQDLSTNPPF